ncbi:preprotein translocase subunit SecE [bacterium]|nr:preprotein translocase subunit SecE [bacterium]
MTNQAEKTVEGQSLLERGIQFLKEVRAEVAKVTWPGSTEVKGATVVVIVVCVIVAFIIWGIDKLISLGMDAIF